MVAPWRARRPESLPVKEIDRHIGSLTSVCIEVETRSGPVCAL
jgi:hypothetical protein